MRAERLVQDAPLNLRASRVRLGGACVAMRVTHAGLGGIPVEYKGATVPPPDQRRTYS